MVRLPSEELLWYVIMKKFALIILMFQNFLIFQGMSIYIAKFVHPLIVIRIIIKIKLYVISLKVSIFIN